MITITEKELMIVKLSLGAAEWKSLTSAEMVINQRYGPQATEAKIPEIRYARFDGYGVESFDSTPLDRAQVFGVQTSLGRVISVWTHCSEEKTNLVWYVGYNTGRGYKFFKKFKSLEEVDQWLVPDHPFVNPDEFS